MLSLSFDFLFVVNHKVMFVGMWGNDRLSHYMVTDAVIPLTFPTRMRKLQNCQILIALAKCYFSIFSWIRSAFWTSDNMECSSTLIMHAIWALSKCCARAWLGFVECSSSRWFQNKTLPVFPIQECLRKSQMLHNSLEQTIGNWTLTFPQKQSIILKG